MDRRDIIATLCTTAAGGGLAAITGATALPDGSPYFSVLIIFGVLGIVVGLGGLLILLLTATPSEQTAAVGPVIDQTPLPDNLDDKAKALWMLKRARGNAFRARSQWGDAHARSAFHEIRAAMLGIKSQFGVGGALRLDAGSEEPTYKQILDAYIAYADTLYPLLEGGHIEAAKKAANAFDWSYG